MIYSTIGMRRRITFEITLKLFDRSSSEFPLSKKKYAGVLSESGFDIKKYWVDDTRKKVIIWFNVFHVLFYIILRMFFVDQIYLGSN